MPVAPPPPPLQPPQVPCYSYGQKLSKLAILRIACNYILSLAQLAQLDLSPEHGSISFRECVELCTRTLQAEGRSKKRKVRGEGGGGWGEGGWGVVMGIEWVRVRVIGCLLTG